MFRPMDIVFDIRDSKGTYRGCISLVDLNNTANDVPKN